MKDDNLYKAYIKRDSKFVPRMVIILEAFRGSETKYSAITIDVCPSGVTYSERSFTYIKLYELL